MRSMLAFVTVVAAAGCVRNIDPAAHSGADARYKGAHALKLEGTTGSSTGIVTYPGGDRVDWKKIELPPDQQGELALELTWRAPREGLDLAFEVWDQWGKKIGKVKARSWNSARRAARRANGKKSTKVEGVHGIVYVSVYASTRGDAGRYKLEARFTPEEQAFDPKFDELLQKKIADGLKIPDPPKLGRVYPPCGEEMDKSNPDCFENPPARKCNKDKLDPTIKDCEQYYTCTTATWEPIEKNPACKGVTPPAAPPPPPPPESLEARILNPEIKDGKLWITIAVGKDSPVSKGWTGSLVDSHGKRLKKGGFKIIKVQKGLAYATVDMPLDDVNRNLDVILDPPAP